MTIEKPAYGANFQGKSSVEMWTPTRIVNLKFRFVLESAGQLELELLELHAGIYK